MSAIDPLPDFENYEAEPLVRRLLDGEPESRTCLTCSFQAEDIVVLDLLRKRLPAIPVLFLDTGYHFAETYEFRDKLVREWNLTLVNVLPRRTVPQQESELGILYREDPARCCHLRKVEPLMESLEPFDLWFTGLRREQSPTRKNLKKVEHHRLPTGRTLLKISPLADWTWGQVWEYTAANGLPFLPQYDRGFTSIGCEPCTAIPDDPNNPRSGRWGGKKLECGIHTFSEKVE
ncbi:MAG TPA: phosphoadenylyl-sulfate reductase [Candidatus Dormibacteraeota bacterium]|nr:phosphoadenylyl-sulfate reductase [Candidatus Dormibacteraeota bacterium]